MLLKAIRKNKKTVRVIAAFMTVNLFVEIAMPLRAFALTGGPSQPEVQSFEPVSANQMVDPFTGDFTYNIPLLDVGGYPINLAYHAGPGLDEEASWVGLGWNINPGVINRNMRGVPDDFWSPNPDPNDAGNDKIIRKNKMRPVRSYAVSVSPSVEVLGQKKKTYKTDYTIGVEYNNYRGLGTFFNKTDNSGKIPFTVNFDSQDGLGVNINYEKAFPKMKFLYSYIMKDGGTASSFDKTTITSAVGIGINSRQGIKEFTTSISKSSQNIYSQTYYKGTKIDMTKSSSHEFPSDPKFNGGGSISFLNSTYIPSTSDNTYNFSLNLSYEFGGEFKGINPDTRIALTYSQSGKLKSDQVKTYPVYGFLNHSTVYNNYESKVYKEARGKALMDFNTYGQSSLTRKNVSLPYTVSTYDVLAVSGQGISGIYRPHSAAIGSVYQPRAESVYIPPISFGIDLSPGDLAKIGVEGSLTYYKSKSGRWEDDNGLFDHMDYSATRSGADFEQVYYKNAGERTPADMAFFDQIDGSTAVRPGLDKQFLNVALKNGIEKISSSGTITSTSISSPIIRNKRDKRNQVISTLTAKEAYDYGLVGYRSPHAKDHHIGQITAINPDGNRYIYGVPLYNITQQEYTFSFDGSYDVSKGLAFYNHGTDNTLGNNSHTEAYFDYEEISPYAHSYLLSAVVSPDYMDLTGDGPTPDDNGYYTYFEYQDFSDLYPGEPGYKWRTPYKDFDPMTPGGGDDKTLPSATYQMGFHSDEQDDKASYIYGVKEIKYIEKITTKTHTAIFHTSPREDALGVTDDQGRKNTSHKLQKLDSIQLFTNYELVNKGSAAKPIKTVYFKYDYSLCPKVPNQTMADSGKLTLNKVSFKYGNSSAGELSPYLFKYSSNKQYGYKNYDRWGNYKTTASAGIPNDEFPYCEQDEALAAEYASAWSLTEITLPSGGTITIEYEADDYAYVQDRRAMEMVKIAGFGFESNTASTSNLLYWNNTINHNNYVFFELKDGDDNADDYIPQPSSIDNKRYLYMNAHVKLKGTDITNTKYEYIPCYAEIKSWGKCSDNIHGYIEIERQKLTETIGVSYGNVNPISKSAWQFLRLQMPHLAYEGQDALRWKDDINFQDLTSTMWLLIGFIPELARAIVGFDAYQMGLGRAREVTLAKSWIRLQSPYGKKKGGGYRVKQIRINNEWHSMSMEDDHKMGQKYDYTMSEGGRTISSGVASYEPQIGGDENPLRLPSFHTRKNFASLGPEDYLSDDQPLGESVFPAPVVGYRQVKVSSITPQDIDVNSTATITRHGTGYTINKFFTAYDWPVLAGKTTVDVHFKKSPILSLLKFSEEIIGATQGFAIEVNDMHGKPRSMEVYDQYGKLVTKTDYKYMGDEATKRLSNTVTTLKKDGTIDRDALVGYETEMVVNPQELKERAFTIGVNSDLDVFMIGLIPVPFPGFGISLSNSHKLVRTATTTKIINRYGILESVTVSDQSSSVTTSNVAFDDETGEVLLTETTNEFSDKIYNFTYPAHWAYDGMGPAYKNIGANFKGKTISSGEATITLGIEFLMPGDEVLLDNNDDGIFDELCWILDKDAATSKVTFINRTGGKPGDGTYNIRVIRSGRRNMQTIPIGKIVGNKNPIPPSGPSFLNGSGDLEMDAINASAASFSDQWQAYRHDPGCWKVNCFGWSITNVEDDGDGALCFPHFPKTNDLVNPYVVGIKGNWRPDTSYVYYNRDNASSNFERSQTASSNGTNIAVDGKLKDFTPFWYYNTNGEWKNRGGIYTPTPWIWNSRATQINPDGVELENQNALGIYSSAIYSYISKQPVAVTYNAGLREVLNDNFEDYLNLPNLILMCELPSEETIRHSGFSGSQLYTAIENIPKHWYIWPTFYENFYVTNESAHTGFSSLRIGGIVSRVIQTKVYDKTVNSNNTDDPLDEYRINPIDLTDVFSPVDGEREYLLSYWVKGGNISGASITISQTRSGSPISVTNTLISEGRPIEGWVRRELSIKFPSGISLDDIIQVVFNNSGGDTYFDDFRIHPIDANMKSFVYDNNKLRLMATLDENNYATFFEYDEEGNLIRTKRETELGIITISENRQNIKH